ncbi:glycoside hydrolase family 113 [Wenyingzhuangia sp. IMCC45467]
MKFFKKHLFVVFVLFVFVSCSQSKINGVSLVSPPKRVENISLSSVTQINANWVAIIPFAFCNDNSPNVHFNEHRQWWGEKPEGVLELIKLAKEKQLKVFIKPHVWYRKSWIGDFTLNNQKDWQVWEQDYTAYILSYAKIAAEQNVDLFCVGTELKQVTVKRPLFFKELISKVKQVYKGKITYAANWDNVQTVNFWQDLDFIGVDAYYPLSNKKEPTVVELVKAWKPIKQSLYELSGKTNKPILFTEYGFESTDFNTKETWGSNGKYSVNEQAQANAYKAFYKSFYDENWFAGGFLWKWHVTERTIRNKHKTFTPQDKKVIEVIKNQFKK